MRMTGWEWPDSVLGGGQAEAVFAGCQPGLYLHPTGVWGGLWGALSG